MAADTLINVLIDNSGSMAHLRDATIKAYNDFLEEQTTIGDALWSLTVFDHNVDVRFVAEPIKSVKPLDRFSYQIGGGTHLFDAVARGIADVRRLPVLPPKVIFVVQTDGMDEGSTEITKEELAKLIKEAQQFDDWKFVFLGAEDAAWQAQSMGFAQTSTMQYASTAGGTVSGFTTVSNSISNYRTGATANLVINKDSEETTTE